MSAEEALDVPAAAEAMDAEGAVSDIPAAAEGEWVPLVCVSCFLWRADPSRSCVKNKVGRYIK